MHPVNPSSLYFLKFIVGGRSSGPVFFRRRFFLGAEPLYAGTPVRFECRLSQLVSSREQDLGRSLSRTEVQAACRRFWRDIGAIKIDRLRNEFVTLTRRLGFPESTAPKVFRHMFATSLQDANVDPLIRNELMGHIPQSQRGRSTGLGMTATYTHTRPETKRRQLEAALLNRPATTHIRERCRKDGNEMGPICLGNECESRCNSRDE